MNYKLKQIDAIIIIALIVIAAIVLIRAGFVESPIDPETPIITFFQDDASKKLIVLETSSDVLWKDIKIQGSCDCSGLSKYIVEGDEISQCEGTITLTYTPTGALLGSWTFTPKEELPQTLQSPDERVVTPKDEGEHYKGTIGVREWWQYTVVFDQDSELAGWTLTIVLTTCHDSIYSLKNMIFYLYHFAAQMGKNMVAKLKKKDHGLENMV